MSKVTRDVIADLWPLYGAGEASADTRALVDAFLREDPQFEQVLREAERQRLPAIETLSLPPDHELKTLDRVKKRLKGPRLLMQLAIAFSCLAFGRIVSDTSFDVSPRKFVVTAIIAICFWIAFLVRLFRGRREVLVRIGR